MNDDDAERIWAFLAYLGSLALPLVSPLIVYRVMKNRSRFARFHASQSFNIQATGLIFQTASILLALLSAHAQSVISYLFGIMVIFFGIAMLSLMVTGAVDAAKG